MKEHREAILLIYTGGTIGMINHVDSRTLVPVDFNEIESQLPELRRFDFRIDCHTFIPTIDSSNADPDFWSELAGVIMDHYEEYDGFVVLHGTDTMAYSASALSFMLENLEKPVIFTGSQLPIGVLRTDGKENLLTAIELAADRIENRAVVPEVCIFFQNYLFRGNRTTKYNAEFFNAFKSYNYPALAETGISVKYNHQFVMPSRGNLPFGIHKRMDRQVGLIKIFPGMTRDWISFCLNNNKIKAFVLETFGTGNAITSDWFLKDIESATQRDIIILNVTQCHAGSVKPGVYETSRRLHELGVVNGSDMTTETAITKLMYLLGKGHEMEEIKIYLNKPLRGEISI